MASSDTLVAPEKIKVRVEKKVRVEEVNPRVDLAFKKIFGTIENKDLLIAFINSIVRPEDKVADIEVINPYNERSFKDDKLSILDIKAKDAMGHYYNIEVQITDEQDYDKRALYYWAKLYAGQLKKTHHYGDLKKAIGIHVLNFLSIPDEPNYFNHYEMLNTASLKPYFKDIQMYTIELNKFEKGTKDDLTKMLAKVKTALDRWAAFLTRSYDLNKDDLPEEMDDENIKAALDVLDTMNFTGKERDEYEGRLKWLMIEANTLEKAKKDGIEEGRAEGRAEVAKRMLQDRMSIKVISRATGLTEVEIKRLK